MRGRVWRSLPALETSIRILTASMIQRQKRRLVLFLPHRADPAQGVRVSADLTPLELLQIAAIPDREGYEVVLIDAMIHEDYDRRSPRSLRRCAALRELVHPGLPDHARRRSGAHGSRDSIELIERSYRHVVSLHRSCAFDRDEWLGGLGRPLKWQFAQWTDDPDEVVRMIATYREYNNAHHDAMVKPYAGAIEAVTELRRRGARLGVVTSKLKSGALRGLACAGFDGLFEVVIGADDVSEPKPAPEPALLALSRLGASASAAFMVGDSPHDIRCGQLAGTRTAAVMWGPFPRKYFADDEPDVWLEHPRQLARLDLHSVRKPG